MFRYLKSRFDPGGPGIPVEIWQSRPDPGPGRKCDPGRSLPMGIRFSLWGSIWGSPQKSCGNGDRNSTPTATLQTPHPSVSSSHNCVTSFPTLNFFIVVVSINYHFPITVTSFIFHFVLH